MQIAKVSENFTANVAENKASTDLKRFSDNEYLNSNFVASYQLILSGASGGGFTAHIDGSFDNTNWQQLTLNVINNSSAGVVVLTPWMRVRVTGPAVNAVTGTLFLAF